MSLTPFEDILVFSNAPSANPAKVDSVKEVTELKIQLDSMSRSVPEDQDDLVEDQEMWCARWQKLLSQVHTSFQCVKEHGMDTALEADLLFHMQERRSGNSKKRNEQKRQSKVASSGDQEQVPVAEPPVESAAPSPVQESANEPPTTESPSEEQESVSSVGQKRKHVSSQVVVDEEEDEEEDIVEVVALKPSRAPAGPKTVTHNPPCYPCQRGGRTCTGVPGRTCNSCIQLKTKCRKSKGKGKVKKDMALIPAAKTKGKEKGHPRPVRNNARVVIPAELPDFFGFSPSPQPDSDHEDNNATPHKKAKLSDLAWHTAIETMKLALLTMQTKMHRMLGFLSELQVHAKVAKTYIGSQQLEIEEMEALLEEL
ncbi:hypothetical protein HD554DRAFT_2035467 [Boletus coccyginus]|nr:hypothetical protein HD554DRAFT_2035467 [Boletus coccyginus]